MSTASGEVAAVRTPRPEPHCGSCTCSMRELGLAILDEAEKLVREGQNLGPALGGWQQGRPPEHRGLHGLLNEYHMALNPPAEHMMGTIVERRLAVLDWMRERVRATW